MLPRPTWTSTLYNTCALVFLAKQKIKCLILLIATRICFLLMRRPWRSPRGTVASCNIVHRRISCSKASEISECSSSSGCSGRTDFLSFNLLMNLISSQFNVLGNLNLILNIYTHSQLDRKPIKFIDLVLNVLDKFRSRKFVDVRWLFLSSFLRNDVVLSTAFFKTENASSSRTGDGKKAVAFLPREIIDNILHWMDIHSYLQDSMGQSIHRLADPWPNQA